MQIGIACEEEDIAGQIQETIRDRSKQENKEELRAKTPAVTNSGNLELLPLNPISPLSVLWSNVEEISIYEHASRDY